MPFQTPGLVTLKMTEFMQPPRDAYEILLRDYRSLDNYDTTLWGVADIRLNGRSIYQDMVAIDTSDLASSPPPGYKNENLLPRWDGYSFPLNCASKREALMEAEKTIERHRERYYSLEPERKD